MINMSNISEKRHNPTFGINSWLEKMGFDDKDKRHTIIMNYPSLNGRKYYQACAFISENFGKFCQYVLKEHKNKKNEAN